MRACEELPVTVLSAGAASVTVCPTAHRDWVKLRLEAEEMAASSLTAVMGRLAAYTGERVEWGFVTEESTLDLMPADLIGTLAESHGEHWRACLTAENIRVAVNQELVTGDVPVAAQDEVAFFPPVTGG